MKNLSLVIVIILCCFEIGCENYNDLQNENHPIIGTFRCYVVENDTMTNKPHTDVIFLDSTSVRIYSYYFGCTGNGSYLLNEYNSNNDTVNGTITFQDIKYEWDNEIITNSWTMYFEVAVKSNLNLQRHDHTSGLISGALYYRQ